MTEELIKDVEEKMNKAVEFLVSDLSTLRAGRATPNLLDKVLVNYYGQPTPLKQMANISAPEARLLVVQPWDKGVLPEVEKAIMKSDLGITPSSDGVVIRLAIPALTEERRKDLVKIVKKKGEESKVAVRNIRREANEGRRRGAGPGGAGRRRGGRVPGRPADQIGRASCRERV